MRTTIAAIACVLVSACALAFTGTTRDARDATAEDLAFLTGTWRGQANGSVIEEVWSAPVEGDLMGMFRWFNPDASIRLYEMLSVAKHDDGLHMRIRHFNADFTAWEDKDSYVDCKLVSLDGTKAEFKAQGEDERLDTLTYEVKGDTLTASLVFKGAEGRGFVLTFDRVD